MDSFSPYNVRLGVQITLIRSKISSKILSLTPALYTYSVNKFPWDSSDKKTECTLIFIKEGAVLSLKGDSSLFLPKNGKPIQLPADDSYSYAKGPIREKPHKDSKILFNTSVPVKVIPVENQIGIPVLENDMRGVMYNGKKGFVDLNDFGETSPEVIIGDKVRFRDKPSTDGVVIAEFSKWIIVGSLGRENDKWVRITYHGKIGFVAKEFVTGFGVEANIFENKVF
jgi:hypothetical protein